MPQKTIKKRQMNQLRIKNTKKSKKGKDQPKKRPKEGEKVQFELNGKKLQAIIKCLGIRKVKI